MRRGEYHAHHLLKPFFCLYFGLSGIFGQLLSRSNFSDWKTFLKCSLMLALPDLNSSSRVHPVFVQCSFSARSVLVQYSWGK